ncbi:MAG: InlB B-repeat-containing protein [Thermodesulfobacteriota bacterium]
MRDSTWMRLPVLLFTAMFLLCIPFSALAAEITLSWEAPSDLTNISGYHIYYGADEDGFTDNAPVETLDDSETSCVISGLEEGRQYFFAATSTDGNGGESDFSEIISYTVPFSPYTIAASAGDGGTISPAGDVTVSHDSSQTFDIQSDSGYQVSKVVVDGEPIGPANSHTFTAVSSGHTIEASFAKKQYRIDTSADPAGGGSVSGGGSYDHGASVSLTAAAAEGHDFVDWTEGGSTVSTDTTLSFTAGADRSLTARFAEKQYSVTFSAAENGGIDGQASQTVKHDGSAGAVTAQPDENYAFTHWSGDYMGTEASLTLSNVVSDMRLTANFERAVDTFTLTYAAGTGGTISGASPQVVDEGESGSAVTAVADSDYEFVRWSDGSTANPRTETNVAADLSVTAKFQSTLENPPPHTPVLLGPEDGAEIAPGKSVLLEAEAYDHPKDAAHLKSRWQIRRYDQKKPFYDATSEMDLLSHEVAETLEPGMRYVWRVGFQDTESGLFAWSEKRSFVVGQKTVDTDTPPVEPGQNLSENTMASFVHWPEDASAEAVFGPHMDAGYDLGDYRLCTYDPNKDGNGGYHEYPDFEVEPGKAYWFLARRGLDVSVEGVPVTTEDDVCVALPFNGDNENGWSMIGVPNKASYHWGNVEIEVRDADGRVEHGPVAINELAADNPYIDPRIWQWQQQENGTYEAHSSPSFTLAPYAGYWVKARAENVYLRFPADMQVALSNPGVMLAGWWSGSTEWISEELLSPGVALADAILSDAPPMPMSGLNSTAEETQESASSDAGGGSSGCFIQSLL